ncbi:CatB-related O-acetyltransferase [Sphingobium limneticum]|uniref:CatB-related O-acetyltransferase n=1 Tax=Sphingobium limneticum TaxID=1007511 RepID=UPI00123DA815|nr:CatB-related O-acetyltransferase [Sphingobium limneticum]KAA9013017.1 CatB-related O-acetyltransferase [Sphingobium limneticum]
MSFIATLIERGRLWYWRRSQHDNLELRRHFSNRYRIDVGMYSYGCFDRWRMPGPIQVGRYCSIASTVRSAPINHPYDALTTHPALYERKFGAVTRDISWDDVLVIEDDVWIAHNVVILPGCKFIGRGSIIGAGAIVTRNVDRYVIVAGNPARKLRDRFSPELAEQLEASRWWELNVEELGQLIQTDPDLVFHPSPGALRQWSRNRAGGGR